MIILLLAGNHVEARRWRKRHHFAEHPVVEVRSFGDLMGYVYKENVCYLEIGTFSENPNRAAVLRACRDYGYRQIGALEQLALEASS